MTANDEAPGSLPFDIRGASESPVILVLGGISASRHVVSSAGVEGWWDDLAGPARVLDTDRFRLLGVEYLDGGRADDGRPASIVTTHDQARAIVSLLDELGIECLHAVVGASYGAMVALALAERWPARVGRVVAISGAHESYAMSTALRSIQRHIVELGLSTGRAHDAMTLARALGMTTYRSAREFASRFDLAPSIDGATAEFDVERYLLHAGAKYSARTTPHRFLALSLSADLHRVTPEHIAVRATVIAAAGDTLVPASQMRALARRLPRLDAYVLMRSRVGHDAFLAEPERLVPLLTSALAD